jgi:transcriptional regulator with XRE-family HTH domain
MRLVEVRKGEGLSLAQLATAVGLRDASAGHLSRIENGRPASIRLALTIERWSQRRVDALDLVASEDAELLRMFVADRTAGAGSA